MKDNISKISKPHKWRFNIFIFMPFVAKPADQQKKYFYRIDAHM